MIDLIFAVWSLRQLSTEFSGLDADNRRIAERRRAARGRGAAARRLRGERRAGAGPIHPGGDAQARHLARGRAHFGRGGRQLGQFLRPHGMGIDSEGNLYVGEASTGRRVQKFALRGGS